MPMLRVAAKIQCLSVMQSQTRKADADVVLHFFVKHEITELLHTAQLRKSTVQNMSCQSLGSYTNHHILPSAIQHNGNPNRTPFSLPTPQLLPPPPFPSQESDHFILQMVRETEMAAKTRPSSSQTPSARPSTVPASTIPAWLADEDVRPSARARAAAQGSDGPNSCSSSKSRRSQGARSDVASSPGYHKLSLDLMKSMSGESRH